MIYARTFKDTSSSTNKSFVTKQQTIFIFIAVSNDFLRFDSSEQNF